MADSERRKLFPKKVMIYRHNTLISDSERGGGGGGSFRVLGNFRWARCIRKRLTLAPPSAPNFYLLISRSSFSFPFFSLRYLSPRRPPTPPRFFLFPVLYIYASSKEATETEYISSALEGGGEIEHGVRRQMKVV